jgi:soluble lytic murein transglycosylase-like protein
VKSPRRWPKKFIANMIAHIAEEVFQDRRHQEFWIALLGVESAYVGTAKSSAGAVGLGQLIPTFANDFGKDCDVPEVTADDLRDDYTNAYLSACYFRTLISANEGNIALALASYNAGQASASVKRLKAGASPVPETAGYVAKALAAHETLTKPSSSPKNN